MTSFVTSRSLVNRLLFPAPPSSYSGEQLCHELLWLPEGGLPRGRDGTEVELQDFSPANSSSASSSASASALASTRTPEEGSTLCLFLETPGATHVLLYCHGNAEDVGLVRPALVDFAARWRVHVLAVEYPGYGLMAEVDKYGRACEDGVNRCVRAAYRFLTAALGIPPSRIILFGRSIGSGPCCALAAEIGKRETESEDEYYETDEEEEEEGGSELAALILHSPFLSIKELAAELVGDLGAAFVVNRFPNGDNIRRVHCPLFIIHGQLDELIPPAHAEELLRRSPSKAKDLLLPAEADHNVFDEEFDVLLPTEAFLHSHLEHYSPPAEPLRLRTGVIDRYRLSSFARTASSPHRGAADGDGRRGGGVSSFFRAVMEVGSGIGATVFEVGAGPVVRK